MAKIKAKASKSKAKTKAWNMFSRWVRVKGCIETTGWPFVGYCITCQPPRKHHIRYLEAGHCFPQRRNGGLFDEEAVNQQCSYCNQVMHGRPKRYRKILVTKYGKAKVEAMAKRAKKVKYDRDMDFEGIAEKYKAGTNKLVQRFGYGSYEDMLKEN